MTEGVRLSLLTEQKRSVIVKIQPKESRFPIVIGIALPMFFAQNASIIFAYRRMYQANSFHR